MKKHTLKNIAIARMDNNSYGKSINPPSKYQITCFSVRQADYDYKYEDFCFLTDKEIQEIITKKEVKR